MKKLTAEQILATPLLLPWTAGRRDTVLGVFGYHDAGGGAIEIDSAWVKKNIVAAPVPELSAGSVRMHRLVARQFQRALTLIVELGLRDHLVSFDGGWVPRHMRGRKALSTHSWGAAWDFNADLNPQGSHPAAWGAYGSLREVVPVFAACGIGWGGWWALPVKDGMHFEVARVLPPSELPVLA